MRLLAALTTLALLPLASAAGVPQVFHDAMRNAFPWSYLPERRSDGSYTILRDAAYLAYSPVEQAVAVAGPVGNGPVLPLLFSAAGRFSGAWCGINDFREATLNFADWHMLSLQRNGGLVTAQIGTCKALVLADESEALIWLKRVPGKPLWPGKVVD